MESFNAEVLKENIYSKHTYRKNKFRTIKEGCKSFKKNYQLWIMCLPAIILIFLLNYMPMFGLLIAFKRYSYTKGFLNSDWVGLDNFKFLFFGGYAWRITRNTLGLNLLFIFVTLVFAIGLALLLNEIANRFFIKIYQTVMFFPYFVSWVVAGYMLYSFLKMDGGMINNILGQLKLTQPNWYNEAKYWPAIMALAYLWKGIGYNMIIYYAGIIGIDQEYYEAAKIDGASKIQMVFKISIPLIRPLIIIMLLLSIGRIFYSDFGMFYNLTMDSGSLYSTTDVIDTFVLRSFKVTGEIGMASAAGFYQSIIGFICVMISNFIVKKVDSEYALY